jgi:mono/diheme cytochrome c family protein
MRLRLLAPILGLFAIAAFAATLAAQESGGYVGSDLYRMYCASCHGGGGKGDGPIASSLRYAPPDLTTFQKRNDGKWDAELMGRIIDGRHPVKGHGGADMPVWGDAFKQSREGYSEEKVKARIEALSGYIQEMQVK